MLGFKLFNYYSIRILVHCARDVIPNSPRAFLPEPLTGFTDPGYSIESGEYTALHY